LAAGIGITALVGMAHRLMAIGASFQMVYCGRTRGDMAYLSELQQAVGDRLDLAITDESTRVDFCKTFGSLPKETEVYFCGPKNMLEAARCAWRDLGRNTMQTQQTTIS
jgi:ferredoxin-NADP reductase